MPARIVFDNATGGGRRVCGGVRTTETFTALVTGVRVAEAVGEPVVGRERREGLGGAHASADAPAHAGGVVEHDARGHAASELEHLLERLAYALGVF